MSAVAAGLCAAIAAYLAIGVVSGAGADSYARAQLSGHVKTAVKENQSYLRDVKDGHVIAALPTNDLMFLKGLIKAGSKINIVGVESTPLSISNSEAGRTLLSDIEVFDVVTRNNGSISEQTQGILVLLTKEESERLFGFMAKGSIRIVIAGDNQ